MSYKNLIFEGGGVKGIAYTGTINELNNLNILPGIENFGGASAGAITAIMLGLLYKPDEINDMMMDMYFSKFVDNDLGFLRDCKRFLKRFGWNKGDYFTQWIDDVIYQKTGTKNMTFFEHVGRGYKPVYLIATNLSRQRYEIFSHKTTPHLSIPKAARMSMSIPCFFESVEWKGDVIVDGGVLNNYPIQIFDKDGKPNLETLGCRVDCKHSFHGYVERTEIKKYQIGKFTKALAGTMMNQQSSDHLSAQDAGRTIFIDSLGVKATDFDISNNKKVCLMAAGRQGVVDYFDKINKKCPEKVESMQETGNLGKSMQDGLQH